MMPYIDYFRPVAHYWRILCLAIKRFSVMDGKQSAAAFAHYAFFSLFPLIILFVSVASVFIDRQQASAQLIDMVKSYIPLSGEMQRGIFDTLGGVVNSRGQAGSLALLVLIWSAMQFFTTLISSTNQAWGIAIAQWWHLPLKSLVFLVIMAVVSLCAVAMPMAVHIADQWFFSWFGLSTWLYVLAGFLIPSGVVFVCLLLFYKLAPNRFTLFSEVWGAALHVTLLLQAAQALFVVYLKNFAMFNAVYGAFGGIMALLLWIYVSGCIVIFGACWCAAQAEINGMDDVVGAGHAREHD
jgi:YihY family inner membrane protein